MPILLDTPFQYSPGHAAAPESYPEAKIVFFSVDIEGRELTVRIQYGTTVDGLWVPGRAPEHNVIVENRDAHIGPGNVQVLPDPAYDTLVGGAATMLPTGSPLYSEVALSLYQYLIAQGLYEGTIQ